MLRSFCFRIQMSARVGRAFEEAMVVSNEIYNAALEERIDAWKKRKISITKFDQFKSLTKIRADDERFSPYAVGMLRLPIEQLNEAFKGFFNRVKRGGPAGFPRFRSIKRLRSFGFTEASGWSLKGNVLSMKGLPNVRLKMHRPIHGTFKKLTIKHDSRGRWFAIIVSEVGQFQGPLESGAIGLDLGVEHFVMDSDGVSYGKVRPDRESDRWPLEQAIARKKRGSSRRRKLVKQLARQRQREADRRRTKHFQIASKIVKNSKSTIVIEDLTIRNMTRSAKGTVENPGNNVSAKSGLNRSVLDSGLAQFVKTLSDKAESAGRTVVKVNPKGTSQECSDCRLIVKKALKERWHSCPCGAEYHRDHNAARVILHRGVVVPGLSDLPRAA